MAFVVISDQVVKTEDLQVESDHQGVHATFCGRRVLLTEEQVDSIKQQLELQQELRQDSN